MQYLLSFEKKSFLDSMSPITQSDFFNTGAFLAAINRLYSGVQSTHSKTKILSEIFLFLESKSSFTVSLKTSVSSALSEVLALKFSEVEKVIERTSLLTKIFSDNLKTSVSSALSEAKSFEAEKVIERAGLSTPQLIYFQASLGFYPNTFFEWMLLIQAYPQQQVFELMIQALASPNFETIAKVLKTLSGFNFRSAFAIKNAELAKTPDESFHGGSGMLYERFRAFEREISQADDLSSFTLERIKNFFSSNDFSVISQKDLVILTRTPEGLRLIRHFLETMSCDVLETTSSQLLARAENGQSIYQAFCKDPGQSRWMIGFFGILKGRLLYDRLKIKPEFSFQHEELLNEGGSLDSSVYFLRSCPLKEDNFYPTLMSLMEASSESEKLLSFSEFLKLKFKISTEEVRDSIKIFWSLRANNQKAKRQWKLYLQTKNYLEDGLSVTEYEKLNEPGSESDPASMLDETTGIFFFLSIIRSDDEVLQKAKEFFSEEGFDVELFAQISRNIRDFPLDDEKFKERNQRLLHRNVLDQLISESSLSEWISMAGGRGISRDHFRVLMGRPDARKALEILGGSALSELHLTWALEDCPFDFFLKLIPILGGRGLKQDYCKRILTRYQKDLLGSDKVDHLLSLIRALGGSQISTSHFVLILSAHLSSSELRIQSLFKDLMESKESKVLDELMKFFDVLSEPGDNLCNLKVFIDTLEKKIPDSLKKDLILKNLIDFLPESLLKTHFSNWFYAFQFCEKYFNGLSRFRSHEKGKADIRRLQTILMSSFFYKATDLPIDHSKRSESRAQAHCFFEKWRDSSAGFSARGVPPSMNYPHFP